jgi:hypothetical protein
MNDYIEMRGMVVISVSPLDLNKGLFNLEMTNRLLK